MGASLCCMRPSQPSTSPGEATCSTVVIIKSPVRTRKRVYEADEEEEEERGSTTLKEWLLLKSPNNNIGHHAINPTTKLQLVNARSPLNKNLIRSADQFYTPRISFSADNYRSGKLLKIDERDEDDEGLRFTPILKRVGSQKLKKKVSLRFPQGDDIFIFYSPKQNFEDS